MTGEEVRGMMKENRRGGEKGRWRMRWKCQARTWGVIQAYRLTLSLLTCDICLLSKKYTI